MNKKFTHLMLLTALLLSFAVTSLSAQTPDNKPELHPIEKIPLPDSIRIPVLDFKNTDIRDVLRGLGIQYGVNIFLEPEVSGQVSLYLNDISVKNAIDFIIKRYNYAYTVENGIIKVGHLTFSWVPTIYSIFENEATRLFSPFPASHS